MAPKHAITGPQGRYSQIGSLAPNASAVDPSGANIQPTGLAVAVSIQDSAQDPYQWGMTHGR